MEDQQKKLKSSLEEIYKILSLDLKKLKLMKENLKEKFIEDTLSDVRTKINTEIDEVDKEINRRSIEFKELTSSNFNDYNWVKSLTEEEKETCINFQFDDPIFFTRNHEITMYHRFGTYDVVKFKKSSTKCETRLEAFESFANSLRIEFDRLKRLLETLQEWLKDEDISREKILAYFSRELWAKDI